MKKKQANAPAADTESDIHTAADYETLRNLMIEGGEIHSNTEHELTVFIKYGVAAWIRLNRKGHDTERLKWSRQNQGRDAVDLAVLLANMMES